jgi:hypothetical protein
MDERLRFVARLLEGEKMAPLCREFGISRVAGYKIYERYGLGDRSRRPYRHANKRVRLLGLREDFQGLRAAGRHPHRQRQCPS